MVRRIIEIDQEKCNGCGACAAACHEGAIGMVDGKAQLLRDEGIGRFAVCEVSEAEALRKAGFIDEEILMLRSTTDREELERLVDLNVVCTISSVDTGLALNALAENRSTVAGAALRRLSRQYGPGPPSGGGSGRFRAAGRRGVPPGPVAGADQAGACGGPLVQRCPAADRGGLHGLCPGGLPPAVHAGPHHADRLPQAG